MLILLPPSETKRDGGEGKPLGELLAEHGLSFPELDGIRKKVIRAVVSLAKKPEECIAALKLSPKQTGEIARNKAVLTSPTMPAIDRYTGVLYDALNPLDLNGTQRSFLKDSVVIQSALLGPIGALDDIPAYRLSFDSKLALASGTLKKTWSVSASRALNKKISTDFPLVLDFRSEGYASLAPVNHLTNVFYLRVVTRKTNGELVALNHFNKAGKGKLLRSLAINHEVVSGLKTIEELLEWANFSGIELCLGTQPGQTGGPELTLIVESPV